MKLPSHTLGEFPADREMEMRGEERGLTEGGKARVSLGQTGAARREKATAAPRRRQRLTTSTPPPPPRRVRLQGGDKEEVEEKLEMDVEDKPLIQYEWEYYYDYEYE